MRYCETCGGPLRIQRELDRDLKPLCREHCRLCWMDALDAYRPLGIAYHPPRAYSEADCNSTADTPATSQWLPEGSRGRRFNCKGSNDRERLEDWLAIASMVDPRMWMSALDRPWPRRAS